MNLAEVFQESLQRIYEEYPALVDVGVGAIVNGQQQVRWSLTAEGADTLADLLVLMAQSSAVHDGERATPARLVLHWLSQAALHALLVAGREAQGHPVDEELRDLADQVRTWNRQIDEVTVPPGPTVNGNGHGPDQDLVVLPEARCRGCGCRIFGDVAARGACKPCDREPSDG